MSESGMRLRSVLPACAAVLIVSVFACLLLARCLPGDRAPVSIDPLYADPFAVPFAEARPADFTPSNPYTSDTAMVFYPWLVFMAGEIAQGSLPTWSPLCGGGLPMMGNLSSAVFFPTTWFSFVPEIGVARGMFFAALAKLILGGVFGFALLRRLGAGFAGALLSGLGFSAFGYQVVWLNYSLSNVSCVLPLALWAADRFAERASLGRGCALAAVLAIQFLGGHAETSLALGIAVVAWIGCVGGIGALIRLAPFGVLSLAWCAYQLLPFIEYLAVSQGRVERLDKGDPLPLHVAAGSLPGVVLSALSIVLVVGACRAIAGGGDGRGGSIGRGLVAGLLLTGAVLASIATGARTGTGMVLLDPDVYGSPVRDGSYAGPEMYPDVNGGYVGVVILALGTLYAFAGSRRRIARFVVVSAVLGFGLAANLEPLASIVRLVPPFDLAAGTRMLPLLASGLIVGAGLAVGELASKAGSTLRTTGLRLLIAGAVVLLAANSASPRTPAREVPDGVTRPLRMLSPESGAVLVPTPTERRGSTLRVELRADASDADPGVRAGFHIGGRRLPARVERDPATGRSVAVASWNATRSEAGVYRVQPEIDGELGPPREFVVSRPASLGWGAWLRVAIALLAVIAAALLPSARWLLPFVAACELWRFGEPYNPASRIDEILPRTALTDFLGRAAVDSLARGDGPIRVLFEDVILQPNLNQAYGIEVIRAYDQLEFHPFRRFLGEWLGDVPFVSYNRDTIALDHPLARFLGVAYVVTGRPLALPGFELVFESDRGDGGRVYSCPGGHARAFLADRAVDVARTPITEMRTLDPTRTAFLEGVAPATSSGGSVRFVATTSTRLELEVVSNGPGVLVVADNDYPGWSASVDGVETPILRSHVAFRAVVVPPGTSQVVFEYRPGSLRIGVLLAGVGVLVVAVLGALLWARRLGDRRRETP